MLQAAPVGIGSTYNGHPVALASAYAVVKHFLRSDVLAHVRAMEPVVEACMGELAAKHPCVKQERRP